MQYRDGPGDAKKQIITHFAFSLSEIKVLLIYILMRIREEKRIMLSTDQNVFLCQINMGNFKV